MKKFILGFVFVVGIGITVLIFLNATQSPQISAAIVGLQANQSIAGYARADRIRAFTFPDDHGAHPEFQTEWWYYTGNLESTDGRRFGYQLTFFRRAITPTETARQSDWATNQIYFAHFALTDAQHNSHQASERFSRGAAGLAGATGKPFRVWIENWDATALDALGNRVQLRADDTTHALNLTLTAVKPIVLHGERGLSQKSTEADNASYYLSFTRMATQGTIIVNGESFQVRGESWMDHEWSTAVLGENAIGWDWFSIQLSDQRELMLFQIRQKDGSIEPMSSGTLIESDGTTQHLTRAQFDIKVLSTWTSNQTRATYPARWKISVPSAGIELELIPIVADQEMKVSIVYWEGAVDVSGQSNKQAVTGRGFVEMTGYAVQSAVSSK